MNPRVLRRFILLLGVLTVVMFVFWDLIDDYVKREPGDYYTETGANRLVDGEYEAAIQNFDKALEEAPGHRGALMGRAIVFIQTESYRQAIDELDYLIDYLDKTLTADDKTGRGVLAAAYANRGIVRDRTGHHEEALRDYISAIDTDPGAVEGPGVVHKILYGNENLSSVRKRAGYLIEQFKLPEDERLLRVPALDDLQRMHKP